MEVSRRRAASAARHQPQEGLAPRLRDLGRRAHPLAQPSLALADSAPQAGRARLGARLERARLGHPSQQALELPQARSGLPQHLHSALLRPARQARCLVHLRAQAARLAVLEVRFFCFAIGVMFTRTACVWMRYEMPIGAWSDLILYTRLQQQRRNRQVADSGQPLVCACVLDGCCLLVKSSS